VSGVRSTEPPGRTGGHELDVVRALAGAAATNLERNRRRIDDLNVYPVPDGDTGTNLTLTVRSVVEALAQSSAADRAALAHEITRAALMGARGNSGVILSQIVRGAADVLGGANGGRIDARTLAQAFRSASDAAYRAVRRPVEGTMLTVIREMADEAEQRANGAPAANLLAQIVARGEDAVARTPEMLDILRDAGVVDAGGTGLLEIVRGVQLALAGEPLPDAEEAPAAEISHDAIHQELSQYRYCTVFVIEGASLDLAQLETELEQLGDSLLVVGDADAVKVHVHTDDPGAALTLGTRAGTIAGIEIANMHEQTAERAERLLEAVPDLPPVETGFSGVVTVVAGSGNRRLFESLGANEIIEGGQTMNPSTQQILDAIEGLAAQEVIVLPNNGNVLLSAEQAAQLSTKPVQVVPSRSIQAGLAAMVSFDAALPSEENADAMRETLASVVTGAVTIASRDVELNGLKIEKGAYLGLEEDEPVIGGRDFDAVARELVDRLLAEPRAVLTFLRGVDAPVLDGLVAGIHERHPELELEVQQGDQPHYSLLVSAE
jgi:DAK2 domain fusion protein YloV